jgi:hypothetical protein
MRSASLDVSNFEQSAAGNGRSFLKTFFATLGDERKI